MFLHAGARQFNHKSGQATGFNIRSASAAIFVTVASS